MGSRRKLERCLNPANNKSALTVKANNQTLIKWGAGTDGHQMPNTASNLLFLLGFNPLRKDHTHVYCCFCLLLSRGTKPRLCVAAFCEGSALAGGLGLGCLPTQVLNPPEGFHLGVRVGKCLNPTEEIKGGGTGGIPSYGKLETARAFQREV